MTRADIIVTVLLGGILVALALLQWRPQAPAATLDIVHAGSVERTVSLTRADRIAVAGRLGESEIEIRAGKARFAASPCRHKICVRAGWQSRAGDIAACVPNRLAIVMRGLRDDRVDAISQ